MPPALNSEVIVANDVPREGATVNVLVVAPLAPVLSVTISRTVYDPVALAMSVLVADPVVIEDATVDPPGAVSMDHAKVNGGMPVLDPLSEMKANGGLPLKATEVGLVTEMLGTGGFSATVMVCVTVCEVTVDAVNCTT
jgi:hypothetical protein